MSREMVKKKSTSPWEFLWNEDERFGRFGHDSHVFLSPPGESGWIPAN